MKIGNKKELEEAILELERRKAIQHAMLVQQYHQTTESLKPKNLIKGAIRNVTDSTEGVTGIITTIATVGIGILTKRLFIGKSTSIIKKILGNVVEIGVAKTAYNNTDKIKAFGSAIYNNLFKKKSKDSMAG